MTCDAGLTKAKGTVTPPLISSINPRSSVKLYVPSGSKRNSKSYQKQDEVKGLSQYPWKAVHLLWIYPIISYTFPVHKM